MKARELLQETIIACFIVVLLFARQAAAYMEAKNGFFLLWESANGVALLVLCLILTACLVAVRVVIGLVKWPWAVKVYDVILLLLLVDGLLSAQPILAPGSRWLQFAWLVVAGAIGFSLASPGFPLIKCAKNVCLIFSPFILILFWQVLTLQEWGPGTEPKPQLQQSKQDASPVFFIVFDAWSWKKSTDRGEWLASFPNVRALASQAFVFRNARSPGTSTMVSLPALVYQADLQTGRNDEDVVWMPTSPNPSPKEPSIFQLAQEDGYNTVFVGYYYPYRKILGPHLDYCFSSSHYPTGHNLWEKMMVWAGSDARYLPDPLSQGANGKIFPYLHCKHWFRMNQRIDAEVRWVIEDCPRNTFAFVHWPMPHPPSVFNVDGSYFADAGGGFGAMTSVEGYGRGLKYLDRVIGSLMDQLRSSGKFDDALIVLTSDHGYKDINLHRVPLIIKLPHQKSPYVIDKPFANHQLKPALEDCFRGRLDEKRLLEMVDAAQKPSAEQDAVGRP